VTDYAEVARAETPRGDLMLRRRTSEGAADVVELRVNGMFVTDTHETSSDIELAAHALAAVENPRRVVIGGLGLGFTLQRVLADHHVGDRRSERALEDDVRRPVAVLASPGGACDGGLGLRAGHAVSWVA